MTTCAKCGFVWFDESRYCGMSETECALRAELRDVRAKMAEWKTLAVVSRERYETKEEGWEKLLEEQAAELRDVQASVDARILAERNRCAGLIDRVANIMREANRKKAAAELDLLAADIANGAEVPR